MRPEFIVKPKSIISDSVAQKILNQLDSQQQGGLLVNLLWNHIFALNK